MEASYTRQCELLAQAAGGTNKRSAAWLLHDAEMAPKHKKDLIRLKR
jgi:hypothetical protein